ncbi:UNVERIFIED_CONTAM: Serine/threonine-protein phosphatase 7 long form [Sesamum radiatum]|uniref:Serine/threonine-protein phosphatase 7 long form n=1 Tax=Sesamum radiatum TaxID=300843 RepID=A0AAW2TIE3_SESRA
MFGDPDTTLIVRRGDISFWRILQMAPRHIRVLQVLQNMGFLGVLQCGHIEIDTHLITALVERWRPETHTFHFSVGEATITLQDIAVIWALPVEGNIITGVDTNMTKQQWQNYCHQWLGFQPNENSFKNARIKLAALLDRLLNHTCDDDSPFEEVLQEARVCVMCLIGGLLCPDATGNTVSLLYLRHMENIDEESTSNWGTAVLAYLYRELCTASQRGKTNIGGAMQLLQIWAWSRIITLAPISSNNVADLMPTIDDPENILPVPPYARRWSYHISQTHTAHNAIRIIRNTLDRMQENEVLYLTPYLHGLPELQSLPAYATRTPWNIRCPLINYSIVEMHHVERVLRQFGMIQDIPPNPLVSERRLHQIDRRGRRGEDWVAFHRDYILKWNDVHSLIVVRPDVGNGRGTVPDYMNWYHQISRVQISHRIVSTNTIGYRPTDPRDWEAVYNLAENMTQQAENSDPNDFTALRDLRSRTIAYGHQFMNFSSERYPSVRNRPPGTNEPVPSNVYTPAGPSNIYTEVNPMSTLKPVHPMSILRQVLQMSTLKPVHPMSILHRSHLTFMRMHKDILGYHQSHLKARN